MSVLLLCMHARFPQMATLLRVLFSHVFVSAPFNPALLHPAHLPLPLTPPRDDYLPPRK
jgi:hypothetical protein